MPQSPSHVQQGEAVAEMRTEVFLRWLRGLGVELRAKDGKLALSAPQGVVRPAKRARCQSVAPEIGAA